MALGVAVTVRNCHYVMDIPVISQYRKVSSMSRSNKVTKFNNQFPTLGQAKTKIIN